MEKPAILIQLDPDPQPSTFDAVVAVDAGVDQLFRHGGVEPLQVQGLVHGAMFTRGGPDLARTAIFVGGSDVEAGEAILAAVVKSFFGPVRVSVMLDANGANTTAVAAVLAAAEHLDLAHTKALVLGGSGPVGRRVARLLARQGASVRVASRSKDRAAEVCQSVSDATGTKNCTPVVTSTADETRAALADVELVVAAGAAGVQLLPTALWQSSGTLRVAIDLNAVPPTGIEGMKSMDACCSYGAVICYGALGVGKTKMKIHKAAIRRLFESNDQVLDAEQIFQIGRAVVARG
jgi:methylenetetrahydrofolate/methylenetetrahydromethanopterin dehydrogenase (NADP+)